LVLGKQSTKQENRVKEDLAPSQVRLLKGKPVCQAGGGGRVEGERLDLGETGGGKKKKWGSSASVGDGGVGRLLAKVMKRTVGKKRPGQIGIKGKSFA